MNHMIAKYVNERRKKTIMRIRAFEICVKYKLKCVKQILLTCNDCPNNEYSYEKTITIHSKLIRNIRDSNTN